MQPRVAAGYLALVTIWSFTPLAVKWSVAGVGYELASLMRFVIALLMLGSWLAIRRIPFPRDGAALRTYALAAVNFYSFIAIFWGAQFVPSGWLGLMWGVSPFITAILSRFLLGEHALTPLRIGGMLLGGIGLLLIFGEALAVGPGAVQGLLAMFAGVAVSSFTSVAIKRIAANVSPFALTTLAAALVVPAYALTWVLAGAPLPAAVEPRVGLALLFVGTLGTGVVFVLLYYVLRHVRATQVSLIGMISPVLALIIGNLANGEVIGTRIWAGAAVILAGLILHEYLPRRLAVAAARRREEAARG